MSSIEDEFRNSLPTNAEVAFVPEMLIKMERAKQKKKKKKKNMPFDEQMKHANMVAGILFASKAIVQLLVNPLVGCAVNRVGYTIPLSAGMVIMCMSSLLFAYSRGYTALFLARAVQGLGSSCSSVAGLGMLANHFQDDSDRGKYMGIALGGLAIGVLVGPPFGGISYQYLGQRSPFLILTSLAVFNIIIQCKMLTISVMPERAIGSPTWKLLVDPYIAITAGALAIGNMGIAMMEPSLPIWLISKLNATEAQQGLAFLPASITYLIGTNVFGPLAFRMGRWICCAVGLWIAGMSLIVIPLTKSIWSLIVPNGALGVAMGMVDASMIPTFGYLVDRRHEAAYGSVYAIGDMAFCAGYAIGPACGGFLIEKIGFENMLLVIAALCILYSPLLYFLKDPPVTRHDAEVLIDDNVSND